MLNIILLYSASQHQSLLLFLFSNWIKTVLLVPITMAGKMKHYQQPHINSFKLCIHNSRWYYYMIRIISRHYHHHPRGYYGGNVNIYKKKDSKMLI